MAKPKKILIATGGTGGHIFPAYGLAKNFLDKNIDVTITSDDRGMRYLKDFSNPILSTTNKLDKIKRLKKKDINIKKDIFILSSEIFLSVLKIVLFIILLGLTSLIISKEVIFNKI